MKNTVKIKLATIISFLIIVFPGPHVTLLNFIIIAITFLDFIFLIGIDPINLEFIKSLILSSLAILSLILIFKKSRLFVLACILVQYLWLFTSVNKYNLSNIYYLSTIGLYILISLILIIYSFKKKKLSYNKIS